MSISMTSFGTGIPQVITWTPTLFAGDGATPLTISSGNPNSDNGSKLIKIGRLVIAYIRLSTFQYSAPLDDQIEVQLPSTIVPAIFETASNGNLGIGAPVVWEPVSAAVVTGWGFVELIRLFAPSGLSNLQSHSIGGTPNFPTATNIVCDVQISFFI